MQSPRPSGGHVARRSLGTQAVLLAVATGVGQIAVAVIFVFAARASDPSDFGHAVAAVSLGIAAAGFLDFGTNGLWIRELSTGRLRHTDLRDRLLSKLAVSAWFATAFVTAILILDRSNVLWTAAPIAFATLLAQTSQVMLRSQARGDLIALGVVSDRISALVAYLVLTASGLTPLQALWIALVSGSMIGALLTLRMTPARTRTPLNGFRPANPWRDARYFGVSGLALSSQNLDLPLLAAFGSGGAAGLYASVNRWTQPMGLLATAFATAAAPYAARAESFRQVWKELKRALWIPASAVGGALIVAAAAPLFVDVLLGDKYEAAVPVLRVIALASLASVICQPLAVTLQSLGRDRSVAGAVATVVSLQLFAVAILAGPMGAMGAAWASLAAQVALLLILSVIVMKGGSRESTARLPTQ